MILSLNLNNCGYDIVVERGAINSAGELLNLDRKVLIVTDDMVPDSYPSKIASFCKVPVIKKIKAGEASKSLAVLEELLTEMLGNGFSRKDAVVAVGGGVVGDLAGFAASVYMRGVDFYNIPTTLLSQVDSSIGGKTAVNFLGVKNIVGAFYQPRKVLIDPDMLKTLPKRHFSNGLAEVIKMAITCDKDLFEIIEHGDIEENIETIIIKSLNIKKDIVEKDEKENDLRKVLNFGHTIGHGIEAATNLFHGECVALGMVPMCNENMRSRVLKVLKKANLPTEFVFDKDIAMNFVKHDKKSDNEMVEIVLSDNIGSFKFKKSGYDEIKALIGEVY